MRARYDKSLVKAVGVLLKFTDPPPVGLSLISKEGYRWEKMSSVTICRLNPVIRCDSSIISRNRTENP